MQDINTQTNENEVKEKKTPKELTLFILRIVGNVVFYTVIVLLFLFSLMNINAGSKNGGFPNLFGKGFLSVQTDSMERSNSPRPDLEEWKDYKIGEIKVGDLVYVNKFSKKDCSSLKVGDVITFFDSKLNNGSGALNTHRIVYISTDYKSVITQGDKIAKSQSFQKEDPFGVNAAYNYSLESSGVTETVSVTQIKGVVTGVNHGGGKVIDNIQQNWLWYFVLPVLAFLLFEIFMVVRNIMELKGAKQKAELASDKDLMMADLEAQKEEMRKQILAELQAQQLSQNQKEEIKENVVVEDSESLEETKVEETLDEKVTEEVEPIKENQVNDEDVTEVVDSFNKEENEETVIETANTNDVVENDVILEENNITEENKDTVENETTEVVLESETENKVDEPVEENKSLEEVSEVENKEADDQKKPKATSKPKTSTAKKTTSSATTKKSSTTGAKKTTAKQPTTKSSTAKKSSSSTTAKKSTGAKKASTTKKAE